MSAGQIAMGPSKKFYMEWVLMYCSGGMKFQVCQAWLYSCIIRCAEAGRTGVLDFTHKGILEEDLT